MILKTRKPNYTAMKRFNAYQDKFEMHPKYQTQIIIGKPASRKRFCT